MSGDGVGPLRGVEVEHMLGAAHGPLVKLRAIGDGVILLGQLPPADARDIALHLLEAAARAEYEGDLHRTMVSEGWTAPMIGTVLAMVRDGEAVRHLAAEHEEGETGGQ